MGGRSLNRIFNGSEVSICQLRTYRHANDLYFLTELRETSKEILPLFSCPSAVTHLRQTSIVELLVDLHLVKAQELRTAFATETEELMHHREELYAYLSTKLSAEPSLVVIIYGLSTHAVDVPGHIEKELQIVACHLRIMHIHNPEFTNIVVIGLAHLIVYKSGLCCCQPKIVVWTSPIGEVIIHAATAKSLLLFGIRQSCHIAVIIVTPHQSNIIGNLKSLLIELQHLFVRHKHLHLF